MQIRKVHPQNCFPEIQCRWRSPAKNTGGEAPGRNGVELSMRVPAANSSVRAESGEMPENGRSRRKRVPKTCDCCGPHGKPHAPGHQQVSKRRGRRRKEMLRQGEEVAAEEEVVSSAAADSVVTLEADGASEMDEAPSPKDKPELSQTERGSESTLMENSAHAHPSDTKELSASVSHNDLMKKHLAASLIRAEPDAMETEPLSKASWDHHYCKPLAEENRSGPAAEETSALPPAEFTTEGIIECIHGSVWMNSTASGVSFLWFGNEYAFIL